MKPLVNRHEMDCHHPWPRSADSYKENPKVSQWLWARKVQKKPGRLITCCWSISWPGQIVKCVQIEILVWARSLKICEHPYIKVTFQQKWSWGLERCVRGYEHALFQGTTLVQAHTLGWSQPPLAPALGMMPSPGIHEQQVIHVHIQKRQT